MKKTIKKETVAQPVQQPTPQVEVKQEQPVLPPHKTTHFVGAWAYIIGIVVALAASIWRPQGLDYLTIAVLAVLGIVVGVLNITDEEVVTFLVASLAFIVSASSVRLVLADLLFVETFMNAVIIFTAASAFIVSVKAIFQVAKNE